MIEIMKRAAMDAIENNKPCDLRFGTVSSVSPLKVKISSELTLPESVLIVPQHLTDYTSNVNIGLPSGSTPTGSISVSVVNDTLVFSSIATVVDEVDDESMTDAVDERTLTVYNGLEVGDTVVLLRNQGGSSYLILDRI